MAEKARLFHDHDTARRIMNQTKYDNGSAYLPKEHKKHKSVNQAVKGFQDSTWTAHARSIVYRGTLAKFTQNPKLRAKLLATGTSVLAEASKADHRWGIGLAYKEAIAVQQSRWKGSNWLGQVLMLVRSTLHDDGSPRLSLSTDQQSNKQSTTATQSTTTTGSKNKLKAFMLRSCPALAALIGKFRLKFNVHSQLPNLVQLHYSQMESQMASAVVQECRGIILARQQIFQEQQPHTKVKNHNTKRKHNHEATPSTRWRYRVVAMPFYKFFNFAEQYSNIRGFDWTTARVHEKLDGFVCAWICWFG